MRSRWKRAPVMLSADYSDSAGPSNAPIAPIAKRCCLANRSSRIPRGTFRRGQLCITGWALVHGGLCKCTCAAPQRTARHRCTTRQSPIEPGAACRPPGADSPAMHRCWAHGEIRARCCPWSLACRWPLRNGPFNARHMKPAVDRSRKLQETACRMMLMGDVKHYLRALRLLLMLRERPADAARQGRKAGPAIGVAL